MESHATPASARRPLPCSRPETSLARHPAFRDQTRTTVQFCSSPKPIAQDRKIGLVKNADLATRSGRLAVRPDLRGRGVGTAVLSAFQSGPGKAYQVLEGRITPDNVGSIACCRRCGFTILPELDAEGFIQAIYRRSRDC
ncbi:GNAT family N-acetyltransferase [Neorhizobium sp. 2083]|uniref:GNAT family N-acetyltransferase n=1 Tax=Neorhizobium sp. 2083 TaxID=2817762 RepID=UPI00386216E8